MKPRISRISGAAPRGVGATDESMRMMASLGQLAAAPSDFRQPCACQTYHKHPGENWPESEFRPHPVPLMMGGHADMHLAERGSLIGSGKDEQLWVREIRKRVSRQTRRKEISKHLTIAELPEEERFLKLATRSKHFIDTIKIIAYRAETALAHIVRERLNIHHQDEARALIRDLCTTPADIHLDPEAKTLTITLHSLATPKHNAAIAHLCAELNDSETHYPGTDLLMIFKSVSS